MHTPQPSDKTLCVVTILIGLAKAYQTVELDLGVEDHGTLTSFPLRRFGKQQ